MEELKKCPFCGGEAELNMENKWNIGWVIWCECIEFPASNCGERKGERMEELKKCPFCGGEAELNMENKWNIGWVIWCECKKCHAESGGYCPTLKKENEALDSIRLCEKRAIEAWNRRVE